MYDIIQGKVICLACGKEFVTDEQIKWSDCTFTHYKIGDKIPASNREYTYGSDVRTTLDTQCPYCNTWQHFKVVVRNDVLDRIETTELYNSQNSN